MVIIDAGHGGADYGGGSNDSFKEKDLTLKISLYEYNRLKELGIPVSLTRDQDIALSPNERVNKVLEKGNSKNDLLISNHINVDFGNYQGAEVIYALRNNDTFAKLIAKNLADVGQGLSTNEIYTRKNQKGEDYYYIIRKTKPLEAVIVEYGFADSDVDTQKLNENWENLAEAVVKSICEYLGYPYYKNVIYTVKSGDTLYLLANKYNVTVEALKEANGLTSNLIKPGQKLIIP